MTGRETSTVTTALSTIILAHQGGWDEMLMVATPIALLYLILRVANRRARELNASQIAEPNEPDPAADPK